MRSILKYYVDYHYVKGKENVLVDGMSRLPIRTMGESKETGEWEDVVAAADDERERWSNREIKTGAGKTLQRGNRQPSECLDTTLEDNDDGEENNRKEEKKRKEGGTRTDEEMKRKEG